MKFLLPQGIGDSIWALHKIRSVAKAYNEEVIYVFLNCNDPNNYIQCRALEFVKRFKFVVNASMMPVSIHPEDWHDGDGHYVYISDGWKEAYGHKIFTMMPNGPLERGVKLADWLPEYPIDWGTPKEFLFTEQEEKFADTILKENGPYCTFYLGPLDGNLGMGHNRGQLWTPEEWLELGKFCQEKLGLKVMVLGADYDVPYYEFMVEPNFDKFPQEPWLNMLGQTEIGDTFALVKRSRFTISYQSGIGIFSSYLGIPTGIFWRARGSSINPEVYISFEESMASGWVRPDMIESGKHMPLIYGRNKVDYVMEQIEKRGW